MRAVRISDAAVVTGLGPSLRTLWSGLLGGRTALLPVTRFPAGSYASQVASCVEGLLAPPGASLLGDLARRALDQLGEVPRDAALVTATTKGGIDNLERLARGEPADARELLFGPLAQGLARELGLSGPVLNVSAACASSTIALARAAAWVASGRVDAALVLCVDLVTEFVFSGFSALRALSPGPCRPFDRRRAGLSLGEGAAALLLVSEERGRRDGRRHLGSMLGWGVADDAHHITAPARDGAGLAQAVEQALARAGLRPGEVAAVCAHGTGTVFNDAMELTAFRSVFGERAVPLHSVKGAIGHTLGAAGGIEAALGLASLWHGCLPPTVGLEDPEPAAEGRVSAEAVPFGAGVLVTSNSGFGGVNAALVLGRGEDAPW